MKTRGIIEGALFCVLTVILALASYYIPFFVMLVFFIPVPVVVLGKRQGLKVSIISMVAAIILIGLFLGPINALAFGSLMLFVGCGLGFSYYKNSSPVRKVIVGVIGFSVLLIAVVLGYKFLMGVSFTDFIFQTLETSRAEMMTVYQTSNILGADQLSTVKETMDASIQTMKLALPSTFLLLPVVFSMVNVVVCDLILKRMGYSVQGFKPLYQWLMPNSLKHFLAVFIIGDFTISIFQITAIPQIYMFTLMALVDIIFLIMGFSFIFDYIEYKKIKSKVLKVVVVILGLFLQSIIILLGVADTYIGIRRIFRRETQEK